MPRYIAEATVGRKLDFAAAVGKPMHEATRQVHQLISDYLARFDTAYVLEPLVCDPANNTIRATVRHTLELPENLDPQQLFQVASAALSDLAECDCEVASLTPVGTTIQRPQ